MNEETKSKKMFHRQDNIAAIYNLIKTMSYFVDGYDFQEAAAAGNTGIQNVLHKKPG